MHRDSSLEVPANIDALAANLCIRNVLELVQTFRFIEAAAGMRVAYRIGNRHRESLRTGYPVLLSTDEGRWPGLIAQGSASGTAWRAARDAVTINRPIVRTPPVMPPSRYP